MLLLNLLEKMDLESSQKEILKQVIVKSCLTTASFKLMTDEQLMAIGFPLPAVIEMKSILANEAQVLTPVSSNTPTSLSLSVEVLPRLKVLLYELNLNKISTQSL